MTDNERLISRILDSAVECYAITLADGTKSVCRDDILRGSRKEDVVLARCLFVDLLVANGFTISTIAKILGRSDRAIRKIRERCLVLSRTVNSYRAAYAEAKRKCGIA